MFNLKFIFPSFQPSANYRFGDCSDVEGHFDPFNRPPPNDPSYFCTPDKDNITNCEVGDLTGKHDQITVSGRPGPYQEAAFFFTDVFLNLTGVNAIEGCSIIQLRSLPPLIRTEKRVASQFPSSYFQVSQPSPYQQQLQPIIACAPLIRTEKRVASQFTSVKKNAAS